MGSIVGTSGNDTLTASAGGDTLSGLEGDDILRGGVGVDVLVGGAGNDSLDGGGSNDSLSGGDGNDFLNGGFGNDLIDGGAGNDTFSDFVGQNTMNGGDGADRFQLTYISTGNLSTLTGGAGQDRYIAAGPAFTSVPGNSDFTTSGHVITDFVAGPNGDVIDLSGLLAGVVGNPFSSAAGILRLVQSGADTLLQYDVNGAGGDPYGGFRTIFQLRNVTASTLTLDNFGGIPPDGSTIPSPPGPLVASGPVLNGTPGNDTLIGTAADETLNGLGGNDTIRGGGGADRIDGGSGTDALFGEDGDDFFLYTFAASSTGTGGPGRDTYVPGPGARDFIATDFTAGAGGDLIDVDALAFSSASPLTSFTPKYMGGNPFASGFLRLLQSGGNALLQWDPDAAGISNDWRTVLVLQNVQTGALTADNFVGAIHPSGAPVAGQTITGTSATDRLTGTYGDDVINGLAGEDLLGGGPGNDTLDGGPGADIISGGIGDDTLIGGDGNDHLSSFAGEAAASFGNDVLLGGNGNDLLYDVYGNNTLDGGTGDDSIVVLSLDGSNTVTGGAGRDTFILGDTGSFPFAPGSVIFDFTAGPEGDLLDVDQLLAPIGVGSTAFSLGYLRFVQQGAHTLLQLDKDGAAGTASSFVTVVTLNGVTASAVTSDNFVGKLIVGTEGDDTLRGGLGSDTIRGLGGNDVLDGNAGGDTLDGGRGADTYYVDDFRDVVIELDNVPSGSQGLRLDVTVSSIVDTVVSSVSYALGAFVENLTLAADAGDLIATGNELDNSLIGNAGANYFTGAAGNDTISGRSGVDTAIFSGSQSSYTIGQRGSTLIIDGPDGRDELQSIEYLAFGGAAPVSVLTLAGIAGLATVTVTRNGASVTELATPFSGTPIAGIQIDYEFLGSGSAEVAVGSDSNDFFNLLGGDDAAAGGAGNDILDGGIGSNFLNGNAGTDTFFLDGRGGTVTWSTITDWQAGEQLSVWGWNANSKVIVWRQDGAAGFQGITMHADLNNDGTIDTSVTWTGKTQAELPIPGQFSNEQLLWFV